MASPKYQPVGPIGQNDSFILMAIFEGQAFVLSYQEQEVRFRPLNPSGCNTNVLNPNSIVQIKMQGTLEKASLVTERGTLLGASRQSGPTIAPQDPSNYIYPYLTLKTSYQTPPSPNLLLSGAAYTLVGSVTGTTPNITLGYNFVSQTSTVPKYAVVPVYPVPSTFYFSSSTDPSQRTCSVVTDPVKAADVFRCSYMRLNNQDCVSYCQEANVPIVAWSNASDCSNSFGYRYCKTGEYCSGNCYGICENQGTCSYSVQNQRLFCTSDLEPISPPTGQPLVPVVPTQGPKTAPWKVITPITPWYKTWWFFALVIVFIILFFYLVYLYTKRDTADPVRETNFPNYSYPYQ
jgi:hypothetical protein